MRDPTDQNPSTYGQFSPKTTLTCPSTAEPGWDSGAGRVSPPPLVNLPPVDNPQSNIDPHEDVRSTPLARQQKSEFLQPDGAVVNVCGGRPCRTSVYTP